MTFRFIFFILLTTIVFHSCSSTEVEQTDPAVLYKEAEEDISNDRFQSALEKLGNIKNKFPYSNFAITAKIRIADVYFLQENYLEAAAAYESYRDLHPKHERMNYGMFRIGESYFMDIPSNIARDLTSAHKALDAFNTFVLRFSNDPELQNAKKRIMQVRDILGDKELYIANFYYKQDQFESAERRYKKLLELYPETSAATEAKEKLAKLQKK